MADGGNADAEPRRNRRVALTVRGGEDDLRPTDQAVGGGMRAADAIQFLTLGITQFKNSLLRTTKASHRFAPTNDSESSLGELFS